MLNQKIEKALNNQLNAELASSYLYLSMAAYLENKNLKGMASWMKLQSKEELGHIIKLFDYINERNGKVTLETINAPMINFKSVLNIFEIGYKHECNVSKAINDLVSLVENEKDRAAFAFLQWYVEEQVEEEASFLKILDTLKLIQSDESALFILDKELGQRSSSS